METEEGQKEEKIKHREEKKGRGALFIPGGLFIGMGLGFLSGNFPAGLFIGLGLVFVAFAISLFYKN